MIVLDASAVVEWLLGSERGEGVVTVLQRHEDGALSAPDLLDVEVTQTFRRLTLTGAIPAARAEGALDLLARLPISRRSVRALIPRIWSLREDLSAYDAAYVALAEALECPLLTSEVVVVG